MSCSVLQFVASCCSVLQCVALWISKENVLVESQRCAAVCCMVLHGVAVCCSFGFENVCCSMVQHDAMCCSVLQCVVVWISNTSLLRPRGVLKRAAACCSVLQRVAACCIVLQCIAVEIMPCHSHRRVFVRVEKECSSVL